MATNLLVLDASRVLFRRNTKFTINRSTLFSHNVFRVAEARSLDMVPVESSKPEWPTQINMIPKNANMADIATIERYHTFYRASEIDGKYSHLRLVIALTVCLLCVYCWGLKTVPKGQLLILWIATWITSKKTERHFKPLILSWWK